MIGSLLGYAFYKAKKRKRRQKEIREYRNYIIGNNESFEVKYASEKRFRKIWKLFPWEGAGNIFITNTELVFIGNLESEEKIELRLPLASTKISWIGKQVWPNGGMSWVEIDNWGEKFYFTSETGATIIHSKNKTLEIYNKLGQKLIKPSQQEYLQD